MLALWRIKVWMLKKNKKLGVEVLLENTPQPHEKHAPHLTDQKEERREEKEKRKERRERDADP